MSDLPFRILTADDLERLSDPPAMVAAVEGAFAAMAADSIDAPPRAHLVAGTTTLLVMPARGAGLFATKLVTVAADNAARGLPAIQGVMQIFDAASGAPLALLDAAMLTAQRTGAVAAVAIKALSEPELDAIGLVGCGVQGAWAAIHAAAVRPVAAVHCLARSEASFERFRATIARHAPRLELIRHDDANAMLRRVTCVVTATTSPSPVLPDEPHLIGGKLFVALGGYRPHMRELPETAFRLARAVLVDSPHARDEAGDLIEPLTKEWIEASAVADFCQWKMNDPIREGTTAIFKSVGHAAFDLFAARLSIDRDDHP